MTLPPRLFSLILYHFLASTPNGTVEKTNKDQKSGSGDAADTKKSSEQQTAAAAAEVKTEPAKGDQEVKAEAITPKK